MSSGATRRSPSSRPRVRRSWRQLGHRIASWTKRLKAVDVPAFQSAIFGSPRRAQIGFSGWFTDYLSPSGYLLPTFACGAPGNISGFCDPEIEGRMERRRACRSPTRTPRGGWSAIEHDIVDQAPWTPLVVRQWVNLVSERLGNYQTHPQYGPLIDQMWVR